MPIKLITLNIEGDKHFSRVLPFFKQQKADVVCLQEVFEADLDMIKSELGGSIVFTPLVKMTHEFIQAHSDRGSWGIATWMNSELTSTEPAIAYYRGNLSEAQLSKHPGYGSSRAVIVATVSQGSESFTIANTHFTWTPDGNADENQRQDCARLLQELEPFSELIHCGDFNAPRGGEIFSKFCEHYIDCLPTDITSTLDPDFHRFKNTLELVVDTIFATKQYQVTEVLVHQGLSDHKAISATISRSPL